MHHSFGVVSILCPSGVGAHSASIEGWCPFCVLLRGLVPILSARPRRGTEDPWLGTASLVYSALLVAVVAVAAAAAAAGRDARTVCRRRRRRPVLGLEVAVPLRLDVLSASSASLYRPWERCFTFVT